MLILAVFLNLTPVTAPRLQAGCYHSPVTLGTDNVPIDSTVRHSVVSISAVLDRSGTAMAWVYLNNSGEHFIQLAEGITREHAKSLHLDARFLQRHFAEENYAPVQLTPAAMYEVLNNLSHHGAVFVGCFSESLHM